MNKKANLLGVYEKALPIQIDWDEKFKIVKESGFDYIELSIDATPERLERLNWSGKEIMNFHKLFDKYSFRFYTMVLSANRLFPLGEFDRNIRERGIDIVKAAVDLAVKLGIRIIQIATYDVYGKEGNDISFNNFIQSLKNCCDYAAKYSVMLSLELMDDSFADTSDKLMKLIECVESPYLQIYYDIGNAAAMNVNNDVQIQNGAGNIVSVHVKDAVEGCCRNIPFGAGIVDFKACSQVFDKINYTGPFVAEMWSNDDMSFLPYLEKAAVFIRRNFNFKENK